MNFWQWTVVLTSIQRRGSESSEFTPPPHQILKKSFNLLSRLTSIGELVLILANFFKKTLQSRDRARQHIGNTLITNSAFSLSVSLSLTRKWFALALNGSHDTFHQLLPIIVVCLLSWNPMKLIHCFLLYLWFCNGGEMKCGMREKSLKFLENIEILIQITRQR